MLRRLSQAAFLQIQEASGWVPGRACRFQPPLITYNCVQLGDITSSWVQVSESSLLD